MTVAEMFEHGAHAIEAVLQTQGLTRADRRALLTAGRMLNHRARRYRARVDALRAAKTNSRPRCLT